MTVVFCLVDVFGAGAAGVALEVGVGVAECGGVASVADVGVPTRRGPIRCAPAAGPVRPVRTGRGCRRWCRRRGPERWWRKGPRSCRRRCLPSARPGPLPSRSGRCDAGSRWPGPGRPCPRRLPRLRPPSTGPAAGAERAAAPGRPAVVPPVRHPRVRHHRPRKCARAVRSACATGRRGARPTRAEPCPGPGSGVRHRAREPQPVRPPAGPSSAAPAPRPAATAAPSPRPARPG